MYKFSETIRYKDTLFTAIFDHQLKLNADFEKSYIYVDELVSMLESLDYQKFREEALDKDVKKYLIDIDKKDRKTGNILRDTPEDVKEAMTRLIYQLRDAAIKQHEAGSWGGDQLKRYRWRLTDFLVHINKRLDEFSELYSDMLEPKEIPFEKCLKNCDKQKVMAKLRELMDGIKGKEVALILEACEKKEYLVPNSYTITTVISEFGLKTSKQSVNAYLNKDRFREDELSVITRSLP